MHNTLGMNCLAGSRILVCTLYYILTRVVVVVLAAIIKKIIIIKNKKNKKIEKIIKKVDKIHFFYLASEPQQLQTHRPKECTIAATTTTS